MKSLPAFRDKLLPIALRWILGGVFIVAGVPKILQPGEFAVAISNYRLLPHEWINLVAITLPWIEVIAGLMLIVGAWVRASAVVVLGMMVMFVTVIAYALARGLNIECGCFGTVAGRKIGLMSLATDAALLGMSVWLSWRSRD